MLWVREVLHMEPIPCAHMGQCQGLGPGPGLLVQDYFPSSKSTSTNGKYITPAVVHKYFGKMKTPFKKKQHDVWNNLDWYTRLALQLKSDLEQSRIGAGQIMGTGGQRSLSWLNSNRSKSTNWVKMVDLSCILSTMICQFNCNQQSEQFLMQDPAKIVLSRQAASCAEVKFLQ